MSFYNQFTQLVHDFLISFIFGFIHFINGSTSTIICNRKIKKDSIVLENEKKPAHNQITHENRTPSR